MANLLTAIRLLLVAPFAYFIARGGREAALIALIIFVIALATDFADGPMARRQGTVSAASGTFDHATDFLFVAAGNFAGASRGAFPWLFPILITAAFAQYVVDSYWRQGFKSALASGALPELKPEPTKQDDGREEEKSPRRWRRGLRGSWLGRWNGILYFAPPCVDCMIRLGARFFEAPLQIFVWLLILSTLFSMGQRLAFREKLPAGAAEK